jgi:hypothetical protein
MQLMVVEAGLWGLKIPLQIQQSEQNNLIQVLTNSAVNTKRVTIAEQLGNSS